MLLGHMRVHASLTALALLALPSLALGQTYITGKVIVAPNTKCDPTATHMLECTDVMLKSSAVTLSTWVGKTADLQGTLSTTGTCNTIDVTSAANAAYSHTITASNSYKLGSNVTFKGTCPFGGLVGIVLSGGPGFFAASTYGTLLIDPSVYVLFGPSSGLLGSYSLTLTIPNDPGLVGGKIWSQTAWISLIPTTDGKLVNAQCFTIVP